MTKSKGARLIQELIAKYGDAVIAESYDYYATRIITDEKDLKSGTEPEDVVLEQIHLSDVETVTSWDDLHRLEEIATGKRRRERYGVEVPESKAKFNTAEQQKLREKRSHNFKATMSYMLGGYPFHLKEYCDLANTIDFATRTTPKGFGMALDNSSKRRQLSK